MENLAGIIVVAIVLIGFCAGIGYYSWRKRNPKAEKGTGKETGAGKVVSTTKRWARSHGFEVIAPARLAGKGTFADIDALVVGYFGILGVKAYGYNGEIYGAAGDAEWLQVAGDGTRTYFDNPITQASSDVRVVRDALFAHKLKGNIPLEVVCVFTEPKAQLALPKSTGHYTYKTFKDLLEKEKYRNDAGFDVEKVAAAVREALVQTA